MEQGPRWQTTTRQLIGLAALVVGLLIIAAYSAEWTGFPGKTLWNWLQLLIVPLVIAAGGVWFNRQQRERELEIADRRAQDEALQAYLDQMGQMLLDNDKPLRQSREGDELRTLARARTLTVLRRLDAEHNRSLFQFLRDSQLVGRPGPPVGQPRPPGQPLGVPIISFSAADLRGANLMGIELVDADLNNADLRGANLRGANLINADLRNACLDHADLSYADISGANLGCGNLKGVNLRGANLAGLYRFRDSPFGIDFWGTRAGGPHQTILVETDLPGAILTDAKVTGEQLRQTGSLEGATMPDGQILKSDDKPDRTTLEDWLESQDRGEAGG